jgi:hypothetical protein
LYQQRKSSAEECPVFGSLFMYGDVPLLNGERKCVRDMLFEHGWPNTIDSIACINGWDAKEDVTLGDALGANEVLPHHLLRLLQQFKPRELATTIPRGVVYPEFLGLSDLSACRATHPDVDCARIQKEIDRFAGMHLLNFVVVAYCGNTEDLSVGGVSPSQIYALATARCATRASFVNLASQHTIVPEIRAEFEARGRLALGDDLLTLPTRSKHAMFGTFLPQGIPLTSAFVTSAGGTTEAKNAAGKPSIAATKNDAERAGGQDISRNAPTLHGGGALSAGGGGGSAPEQVHALHYVSSLGDLRRTHEEYRFALPFCRELDLCINASGPSTGLAIGPMLDLILISILLSHTTYSVLRSASRSSSAAASLAFSGAYMPFISVSCDQANTLAASLLKRPNTPQNRLFFTESRDVLTGFLCHLSGHTPETFRHLQVFL